MAWENLDEIFPSKTTIMEDVEVPTEYVKQQNPKYISFTQTRYLRSMLIWRDRLIWYNNGDFIRLREYTAGANENQLPDRQSSLNTYAQKIIKEKNMLVNKPIVKKQSIWEKIKNVLFQKKKTA